MNDLFAIFEGTLQNLSFKLDMKRWVQEWVSSASLNILSVVSIDNKRLIIRQDPYSKEHPILRQHFIKIKLYLQEEES